LPYDKFTSLSETVDHVHVSLDPIDAMRSTAQDVVTTTPQKGAFTFRVALKDRFSNSIRITDKENKKRAKISVQPSSYTQPKSMGMKILRCSATPKTPGD